ncbi:MAG: adenylate/guanylate cyclase domain-containing protein [Actinobacteria bacterium]|nr:MAG: adenylate/guanylate cyclase domain-containing protein [Actinomycetota bacterium]
MAGLPSGTVTFLFTDIEGSSRLWDEHPGAMGEALVRHDALLREAVEANGGHVVKTTGDGVHAVFETAMNTVAAASAAVRALATEPWPDTGPLRVRMGIHTGAAELRDGDYYGPALNRASRLMEGLRLRDLGEHRLRGLKRPEHIFQLTISGLDDQFAPLASLEAFPGDLAVPFPSFATAPEQLAGRERELELLERALTSAIEGSKQVVLLAGESGMGKTTLAAELARRAAARGTVVLYGRCDEEAIVPHQPFVEALRPYIAAFPPSVLRERLHGLEGDLVRLFPELLGRVATVPEQLLNDPEAERYRLFEAITIGQANVAAAPALAALGVRCPAPGRRLVSRSRSFEGTSALRCARRLATRALGHARHPRRTLGG